MTRNAMGTRVFGASDDLIEFEGDLLGEVGCYGTNDDDDMGVLVGFSDGTLLSVKYGKGGQGVWGITVLRQGDLFDRIEFCNDEDAETHSDVVHFKPGALKAWAAKHCELAR